MQSSYMRSASATHLLSVPTGLSSAHDFQMMYVHKEGCVIAEPLTCPAAVVHLVPKSPL